MRPDRLSLSLLALLVAAVVAAFLASNDAPAAAQYAVVLVLSYVLGSAPWGYILLRWQRGVDIRQYGSGRIGTSNVLRTGGGKIAALVLALDFSKGVVAILLARQVIGTSAAEVAAGLLALAGHNWPVLLTFRGGRGIATGFGGLAVMAPIPALVGAIMFIPITLLSRYLSLGSVTGVVGACLALLGLTLAGIYNPTYSVYAFIGGAMIIWQHRDNIQRLIQGKERRLGGPAARIS